MGRGRSRRVRGGLYDWVRWYVLSSAPGDSPVVLVSVVPVVAVLTWGHYSADRLVYTVTSRKEMPNKELCEEIAKAADDLYELFVVEDARM